MMRFWTGEEGQGVVEYALIIVFISVAVLVALRLLGTNASNLFSYVGDELTIGS
ncbi:MAG: Flp family type IVb pilin [Eubacteriales bacterium]